MNPSTLLASDREAVAGRAAADGPVSHGLEDVVAVASSICHIDGQRGELVYRGYDIRDLGANVTFEETAYLLWHGSLPRLAELGALAERLAEARALPEGLPALLATLPAGTHPMAALRTAVSALAAFDAHADDTSAAGSYDRALRLTAQTPTLIAAFDRMRKGLPALAPLGEGSTAYDFLYMLTGERPTRAAERCFDAALVLHAEHGLNASTFTGRVIASTLSDMYSAVSGAIGALKGPLHGGANTNVMAMLLEIEAGGLDAADYIRAKLRRRERIAGFGHRVYKVLDPRAAILKSMGEAVSRESAEGRWFEMSMRIAEVMEAEKGLYPNVDFYSAPVYYMLGIDLDLYTPIFAMSRMTGWTAHILEQYAGNRLIRPRDHYTGPFGLRVEPVGARA